MALFAAFLLFWFAIRQGLPAQAFLSYFRVGFPASFSSQVPGRRSSSGARAVDRHRKVTAHLRRQGLICKSSFDRLAVGWYFGPKFGKAEPDPGVSRRSLACGIE
jgi:hypothetical protein